MCDLPHQPTVLRNILLRWPEDRNGAKWKYFSALKAHYLKHRVGCKLPPYVTLIITWTQTLTCLFLQPTHVISVNKHFDFFHASLLKYANYTPLCSCSITKKIWRTWLEQSLPYLSPIIRPHQSDESNWACSCYNAELLRETFVPYVTPLCNRICVCAQSPFSQPRNQDVNYGARRAQTGNMRKLLLLSL